jgi:hypothetical protein
MLDNLNSLLSKWEPIWLFLILAYEAFIGTATFVVLMIEYWYDKEFNDNVKAARKERRRKKFEEVTHLTEGEMK